MGNTPTLQRDLHTVRRRGNSSFFLLIFKVFIKDLRVIDRDLADMVLVDNASYSYAYQLANGIPIVPFYDSKQDD